MSLPVRFAVAAFTLTMTAFAGVGCCYSSECCGPQNFGPFAIPNEAANARAEVPPAAPAAIAAAR